MSNVKDDGIICTVGHLVEILRLFPQDVPLLAYSMNDDELVQLLPIYKDGEVEAIAIGGADLRDAACEWGVPNPTVFMLGGDNGEGNFQESPYHDPEKLYSSEDVEAALPSEPDRLALVGAIKGVLNKRLVLGN